MTNASTTINVFADHHSARLTYVLDFIFANKKQAYSLITDVNQLGDSEFISIAYTHQKIESKLIISPCGLLSETDINGSWSADFISDKKIWTLNGISDRFSVLFYFLSRYEEYINKTKDQHGRFTASESVLYKKKQLHIPWCDIIVKEIWGNLDLNIKQLTGNYKTILTYDIDIAWAYKHKPFWRTAASVLKETVKPHRLQDRLSVLFNRTKDPYDNYNIIEENAKKQTSILFFLLGDYGKLDKNHHWKNKALQSLIKSFSKNLDVGIHPSYNSFLNNVKVLKEKERLESITSSKITLSRQHYLRLSLPESYQLLEEIDILEDYTMGYADQYGFRAATSYPFHFFDLKENRISAIRVTPFCMMDGTFMDYMKISPAEAVGIIRALKETIKSVGGQFVPIWHNHTIGNTKESQGWHVAYNACVEA